MSGVSGDGEKIERRGPDTQATRNIGQSLLFSLRPFDPEKKRANLVTHLQRGRPVLI